MTSEGQEPSSTGSRREILGLKFMVYAAVILLAGGYFYHYQALRSAQDEFHREIGKMQAQVDLLMKDRARGYGHPLEETLIGMKGALSNLDQESREVQALAEQVQQESDEFLKAYKAEQKR